MFYSLIPDGDTYIINENTAENRIHLATNPHGIASKHKDRSIPSKDRTQYITQTRHYDQMGLMPLKTYNASGHKLAQPGTAIVIIVLHQRMLAEILYLRYSIKHPPRGATS